MNEWTNKWMNELCDQWRGEFRWVCCMMTNDEWKKLRDSIRVNDKTRWAKKRWIDWDHGSDHRLVFCNWYKLQNTQAIIAEAARDLTAGGHMCVTRLPHLANRHQQITDRQSQQLAPNSWAQMKWKKTCEWACIQFSMESVMRVAGKRSVLGRRTKNLMEWRKSVRKICYRKWASITANCANKHYCTMKLNNKHISILKLTHMWHPNAIGKRISFDWKIADCRWSWVQWSKDFPRHQEKTGGLVTRKVSNTVIVNSI